MKTSKLAKNAPEEAVTIDVVTEGQIQQLQDLEEKAASGFMKIRNGTLQTIEGIKEVVEALGAIHESRAYLKSHKSFSLYCIERWGFTDERFYQFRDSAENISRLSEIVDPKVFGVLNLKESHFRELAALPPAAQAEILEDFAESGEKVTLKKLSEVIQQAQSPEKIDPSIVSAGGFIIGQEIIAPQGTAKISGFQRLGDQPIAWVRFGENGVDQPCRLSELQAASDNLGVYGLKKGQIVEIKRDYTYDGYKPSIGEYAKVLEAISNGNIKLYLLKDGSYRFIPPIWVKPVAIGKIFPVGSEVWVTRGPYKERLGTVIKPKIRDTDTEFMVFVCLFQDGNLKSFSQFFPVEALELAEKKKEETKQSSPDDEESSNEESGAATFSEGDRVRLILTPSVVGTLAEWDEEEQKWLVNWDDTQPSTASPEIFQLLPDVVEGPQKGDRVIILTDKYMGRAGIIGQINLGEIYDPPINGWVYWVSVEGTDLRIRLEEGDFKVVETPDDLLFCVGDWVRNERAEWKPLRDGVVIVEVDTKRPQRWVRVAVDGGGSTPLEITPDLKRYIKPPDPNRFIDFATFKKAWDAWVATQEDQSEEELAHLSAEDIWNQNLESEETEDNSLVAELTQLKAKVKELDAEVNRLTEREGDLLNEIAHLREDNQRLRDLVKGLGGE